MSSRYQVLTCRVCGTTFGTVEADAKALCFDCEMEGLLRAFDDVCLLLDRQRAERAA